MWLAVRRETSAASNSFPTPFPGTAASLLISERRLFCCLHDLVKQALRRSDTHEAADHDARAGRDHRNGFFDGNEPS